MSIIRRFFTYYKPHKLLFMLDFGSACVVAVLELAFPLAVQWFVDSLLPQGEWRTIVLAGRDLEVPGADRIEQPDRRSAGLRPPYVGADAIRARPSGRR